MAWTPGPGSTDGNDLFVGTAGADVAEGGRGADELRGGVGDDTLSGDGVFGAPWKPSGLTDADHLFGGEGNDRLVMRGGYDQIDGGAGIDTLVVDMRHSDLGTQVELTSVFGDETLASISGIERFDLWLGDGGDSVRESGGDDIIRAGGGNDQVLSYVGVDRFEMGAGDDYVSVSGEVRGAVTIDGGAGVNDVVALTRQANIVLTLSGDGWASVVGGSVTSLRNVEHVQGGSGDDQLTGDAANNRLIGYFGEDILRGEGGDDTLIGEYDLDSLYGGAGDDRLVSSPGMGGLLVGGEDRDAVDYGGASRGVTVTLNGAGDGAGRFTSGVTLIDTLRNAEDINGSNWSDVLTGDAGANTLRGYGGNDILRGGAGADVLEGGDGLDNADYRDRSESVVVTLNGEAEVGATVGGVLEDTLSGVEIVWGGSAADRLTGDGEANLFRGGGGADVIDGGAGIDAADFRDKVLGVIVILEGAAPATVKVGGVAEDVLSNIENLYGGFKNDILVGDGASNALYGGLGADTLRGRVGWDYLVGGAGVDTFVFNSVAESSMSTGRDTIADFVSGEDKIRLTFVDADTTLAGDQAFTVGALAAGQAGRLAVSMVDPGRWLIEGDVNGDGVADLVVQVYGAAAAVAADFLL